MPPTEPWLRELLRDPSRLPMRARRQGRAAPPAPPLRGPRAVWRLGGWGAPSLALLAAAAALALLVTAWLS